MKVAFYGGSFNPPHVAHVLAVTYALSVGWAEKVLVVPVLEHAFAKPLVGFEHRLRMAELCMGWLPGVTVSPVEADLPTPSRTLATLEHLTRQHRDYEFSLLIGADQLSDFESWYGVEKLKQLAPPRILGRVGAPRTDAPAPMLPGISSTHVRELLATREQPEVRQQLEACLPASVLGYIEEQGLYRAE